MQPNKPCINYCSNKIRYPGKYNNSTASHDSGLHGTVNNRSICKACGNRSRQWACTRLTARVYVLIRRIRLNNQDVIFQLPTRRGHWSERTKGEKYGRQRTHRPTMRRPVNMRYISPGWILPTGLVSTVPILDE